MVVVPVAHLDLQMVLAVVVLVVLFIHTQLPASGTLTINVGGWQLEIHILNRKWQYLTQQFNNPGGGGAGG